MKSFKEVLKESFSGSKNIKDIHKTADIYAKDVADRVKEIKNEASKKNYKGIESLGSRLITYANAFDKYLNAVAADLENGNITESVETKVLKEDNKYLKDLSNGDYFIWELNLDSHTLTRLEHLVNTMNSSMYFLIDKMARKDYDAASRWCDDLSKVVKGFEDCVKYTKKFSKK